jgi:hypothetical protein
MFSSHRGFLKSDLFAAFKGYVVEAKRLLAEAAMLERPRRKPRGGGMFVRADRLEVRLAGARWQLDCFVRTITHCESMSACFPTVLPGNERDREQ